MKIEDIRQNKNYATYIKSKGWIVEEKNGIHYYIKSLLFFKLMKVQRPKIVDLETIELLQKKHRILQIFIEPRTFKEADALIAKEWKLDFPFLPSKTIFIDLSQTEKGIFSQFSKNTRYSIKRSKAQLELCTGLEVFRDHWKRAVDFKRYVLSLDDMENLKHAFGDNCLLLLANDGTAGGIFLVAGQTAYYWYGFANAEGRKKLALYQVVWEGMKWAKKRGAKQFDLEGIYDERFPIDTWKGFTHFKKGFGGKVKKFPGAYKKVYLPF